MDSKSLIIPLTILCGTLQLPAQQFQAPPAPPSLWIEPNQVSEIEETFFQFPTFIDEVIANPTSFSYWKESADNLDNVTLSVSPGYDIVRSGTQIEGTGAFHLVHPSGISTERITLNPTIDVEADTQLMFESRLGTATVSQIARVEISTNDGGSWTQIWSNAGTGHPGQTSFSRVSLPLAAYAGQSVRIRFSYVFSSGSYYPGTSIGLGWLIDDIQIGETYIIEPQLYSIGQPTALEQQNLEFINRARASASAEAIRLRDSADPDVTNAMSYFNVDKVLLVQQFGTLTESLPPYAFNSKLIAAARLHSQDMLQNAFQGHNSSANPIPPNQAGDSMGARLNHQGYVVATAGENVFSYAKSSWQAHAGFNIDWGSGSLGSIGGMQNPPGHRLSIHSPNFREIGIGIVQGSNGTVGPMLVTQNFGREQGRDQPLLTGVAWNDLNNNGFYDPGEGLAGITVSIEGERFAAVTSASGGYAIPLTQNGEYTVSFSGGGYPEWTTTAAISNFANAKLDYRFDQLPAAAHIQVTAFGKHPTLTNRLRLAVQTSGATPVLQSSVNLSGWADRLDIPAQGQGNGLFWFDITTTDANAVFYRARMTP